MRGITICFGALSALLSLGLAWFALRRRSSTPSLLPFGLLMLANALAASAYTFEINSGSLAGATAWIKVEYIGVCFVPVFWFLFARAFVNESRPMSPGRLALLSALPLATIALMWTNESHGLVYESLRLRGGTELSVLVAERGPWFWVNTAYLYLLMLFGTVAVIAQLSRASGKFRGQIAVISAAVLLPWLGHLILLLNLGPLNLDLSPFFTAASGCLFAFSIRSFDLFDLVPIAREIVVDAMRDAVVVIDPKGRLVDANEAARDMLPPLAAARLGADSGPVFRALGVDPAAGGEFSIAQGGLARHFRATPLVVRDQRRARGSALIISDETETKRFLAELERLVATDPLTQVPNRRHFFEGAERELELARRRQAPVSFAMLDLDLFKRVNDERGHAAGDAALVAFCAACRSALRSTDILARYGGEEFAILLPDADPALAMEIVERVRKAVEETRVGYAGQEFSFTASAGVAGSKGPPYYELDDYLRRADEALYRAKSSGRNRVELYEG